uniref:Uncharacterized protein n=1 Tax=Vespula pensylvanica TaxID=30213 RepID=A0A834P151_VESPE|nr:hypothetical protein H0235_009071 [Vespula pensylvanica]
MLNAGRELELLEVTSYERKITEYDLEIGLFGKSEDIRDVYRQTQADGRRTLAEGKLFDETRDRNGKCLVASIRKVYRRLMEGSKCAKRNPIVFSSFCVTLRTDKETEKNRAEKLISNNEQIPGFPNDHYVFTFVVSYVPRMRFDEKMYNHRCELHKILCDRGNVAIK